MNEGTKTPDPLAAILAEMRDGIHTGRADIIDAVNERLRSYADRIEAASVERVCAPDNAAAMRDALAAFVDSIQWLCDGDERGMFKKQFAPLLSDARAALAAPARNCDRFKTADEAVGAFADHLRAWENAHGICSEYPDHPVQVPAGAFAWLFAPAEGGDHA